MTTFEYRGYDRRGRTTRGFIEAPDIKTARERLAEEGVFPETISPPSRGLHSVATEYRGRIPLNLRSVVYQELSALIRAGVPLEKALDIVIKSPQMGKIHGKLAVVRDRIREGSDLAAALGSADFNAGRFETAMIAVGENTGALGEALGSLAAFLEEQQSVRERIGTALIYPVLVVSLALLILVLMGGVMIPRLARMLSETGIALPVLTRMMLKMGRWVPFMLLACLAGSVMVLVVWRKYYRHRPDIVMRLAELRYRAPLIGSLATLLVTFRFSRTLSLLLRSGMQLVDAMVMAGRATGCPFARAIIEKSADELRHGASLPETLMRISVLDSSLAGWVGAGEMGGDLPLLLDVAAGRYRRAWQNRLERSLAILEPFIILVVGAIVLFLALAVILPLMSLNTGLY